MEDGRNRRKGTRIQEGEGVSIKKAVYIAGILLAVGIIAFVITVVVYNNSLEKIYDDLGSKEIADLTTIKNNMELTEETSTNLRKNSRRNAKRNRTNISGK